MHQRAQYIFKCPCGRQERTNGKKTPVVLLRANHYDLQPRSKAHYSHTHHEYYMTKAAKDRETHNCTKCRIQRRTLHLRAIPYLISRLFLTDSARRCAQPKTCHPGLIPWRFTFRISTLLKPRIFYSSTCTHHALAELHGPR